MPKWACSSLDLTGLLVYRLVHTVLIHPQDLPWEPGSIPGRTFFFCHSRTSNSVERAGGPEPDVYLIFFLLLLLLSLQQPPSGYPGRTGHTSTTARDARARRPLDLPSGFSFAPGACCTLRAAQPAGSSLRWLELTP